jgi:hypothetical protein
MNRKLLLALITIINDLTKKKVNGSSRSGNCDGIGVRAICTALQSDDYCYRSDGELGQWKLADVFAAMCGSLASMSIFHFEGADCSDVYFSLCGPIEEMIEKAKGIEISPRSAVLPAPVDILPVPMPDFEALVRQVESLTRTHLSLAARREELIRSCEEFGRTIG